MFVHLTHLVLSYGTLLYEIFCCSFWMNSCPNHRYRKVVGGTHNVLGPSTVCGWLCTKTIWCCHLKPFYMRYFVVHFDWKSCFCFCAFHTSKLNFILQPQEQESCKRLTQYSSTLCFCYCTQPIWCCPLYPFQMSYFVIQFWSKILLFLHACHKSVMNFIPQPQEM